MKCLTMCYMYYDQFPAILSCDSHSMYSSWWYHMTKSGYHFNACTVYMSFSGFYGSYVMASVWLTLHNDVGKIEMIRLYILDECYAVQHTSRGIVGMVNCGHNTNSSQFYITLKATPWMNTNYVAFGWVLCLCLYLVQALTLNPIL